MKLASLIEEFHLKKAAAAIAVLLVVAAYLIRSGAPGSPTVVAVEVTPILTSLPTGGIQDFTAVGRYSDGSTTPITVTWSATGGSISPSGHYQAGPTAGRYRVIAVQQRGSLTDTSAVTVTGNGFSHERESFPDSTQGVATGGGDTDQVPPPQVVAVELTPAGVALAVGTTQQFSFIGSMSDNTTTAILADWTTSDSYGTIDAAGLYTAGGTAGTFRVIAMHQGGSLADTSAVTVTDDGAAGTGDVVHVSGVSAVEDKWLLQDSNIGGACPSDVVGRFSGPDTSLAETDPDCNIELAVFAAGSAPVLDLAPGWIAGGQDIQEQLPVRWTVPIHVVVEYAESGFDPSAEAKEASRLFEINRMGIEIVIDGPISTIDPSTALGAAILGGCDAFQKDGNSNDNPYMVAGHLNVFYVREDQWSQDWTFRKFYGYDCVDEGLPEVIFIRQGHLLETLAHEIGHALSLQHAGAGFAPFFLQFGWPESNLMRTSIWDPSETSNPIVSSFTTGQVYRANFHDESWLNSGGIRSEAKKTCQSVSATDMPAASVSWPCPLLQLDWP